MIRRATACAAAGADALLLFDLHSEEEPARAAREITGPLVTHVSRGAKVKPLHPSVLAGRGSAVVLYPLTVLQVACKAMEEVLTHLARHGTIEPMFERMWTGTQIYELVGLREVESFERMHQPAPQT